MNPKRIQRATEWAFQVRMHGDMSDYKVWCDRDRLDNVDYVYDRAHDDPEMSGNEHKRLMIDAYNTCMYFRQLERNNVCFRLVPSPLSWGLPSSGSSKGQESPEGRVYHLFMRLTYKNIEFGFLCSGDLP